MVKNNKNIHHSARMGPVVKNNKIIHYSARMGLRKKNQQNIHLSAWIGPLVKKTTTKFLSLCQDVTYGKKTTRIFISVSVGSR